MLSSFNCSASFRIMINGGGVLFGFSLSVSFSVVWIQVVCVALFYVQIHLF